MEFSTSDCAWSQVSLMLLGAKINGLRGFEIDKDIEKEHVYAAGDEPVDIQSGNKKYSGSLKILKFEVDRLNDAAQLAGYADISEVPHTAITMTVQFKKQLSDKIRIISVPGLAFTSLKIAMEQGAKMTEVTLPFLAMRVLHIAKV